ncbi:unnamed protein product [Closterium sp. NIES-64]|nr:unnamed protein product [Closterium sp. NIES-64]
MKAHYEAKTAAADERRRAAAAAFAAVTADGGKRARITDYLEGDTAARKREADESLALAWAALHIPERHIDHPLMVNALNNVSPRRERLRVPHIQDVPCATHVMDLLLEDVGKMGGLSRWSTREGRLAASSATTIGPRGYLRTPELVEGKVLEALKPAGTRSLLDSASVALAALRVSSAELAHCSAALAAMLGRPARAVEGRVMEDFIARDDVAAFQAWFSTVSDAVLRGASMSAPAWQRQRQHDVRLVLPGGKLRPVRITVEAAPPTSTGGGVGAGRPPQIATASFWSIYLRAWCTCCRSRGSGGARGSGGKGGEVLVNAHVEAIVGYSREELGSVDEWFSLLFREREAEVRKVMDADRKAGFPHPRTMRVVRSDGEQRWVEVVGRDCSNLSSSSDITGGAAEGGGGGELWVVSDITDRLIVQENYLDDYLVCDERGITECNKVVVRWGCCTPRDGVMECRGHKDGYLVFDETGITECNEAAVRCLRCPDKASLLGHHPALFSPLKQPDGQLSKEKAKAMDRRAEQHGMHKCVRRGGVGGRGRGGHAQVRRGKDGGVGFGWRGGGGVAVVSEIGAGRRGGE